MVVAIMDRSVTETKKGRIFSASAASCREVEVERSPSRLSPLTEFPNGARDLGDIVFHSLGKNREGCEEPFAGCDGSEKRPNCSSVREKIERISPAWHKGLFKLFGGGGMPGLP